MIRIQRQIPWYEITDERFYENRRQFIREAIAFSAMLVLPRCLNASQNKKEDKPQSIKPKGKFDTDEAQTAYEDVTTYNNFYEFGTDKDSPSKLAKDFRTKPWQVSIEGEVKKPKVYDLDELMKPFTQEDRIYRLRCVEGWSMVIPWLGFPLGELIKRLEPKSKAKYVEFTTLLDPTQMQGQKRDVLSWPYVEGLRMDEAMHPLTLLATGLYGKSLPNQNGAPFRLVVPWKYGFKSIKSIVKIRFIENQPMTTWAEAAPNEYGFYSNVNPEVDHPRWTQKKERRLGEFLKRPTLKFNGYAEEVAQLYTGMDLRKFF